MQIVEGEELSKGWKPKILGVATLEKEYGCDIISTSPQGTEERVEVKGWGEPFRGPSGRFLYHQDVRESQMKSAERDDAFRVEIVANLTKHLAAGEPYERLTLSAAEVRDATPRLWEVELSGKESSIQLGEGSRPLAAPYSFDALDAVGVTVPAAPRFEHYQEFFEVAVPALAAEELELVAPTMVVARISEPPATGRKTPAGPRDRAKAVLDALHDQRRKPPFYSSTSARAPLTDDNPHFVRGLAVEVSSGPSPRTEYRLGTELIVNGRLLAQVDVDRLAPNDIWTSPTGRERIEASRIEFTRALVTAWRSVSDQKLDGACALVIRHHADRDEDNTWSNWLGAITGRPSWSREVWGKDPPLAAWRPTAVASVSDPALPCSTRYEIFGAP